MSIDEFIIQYFPHFKRVRFGWQIITRGWRANLPKIRRVKNMTRDNMMLMIHLVFYFADSDAARILIPIIQEWLYSLCKDNCTTKEHCIVSRHLLYKFLTSNFFVM